MDYIATTNAQREEMLATIGVASIADLFSDIPEAHRFPELDVPSGQSEWEVWAEMRRLARGNQDLDHYTCFLGAGAYRHFVPSTIGHLVSRGEFLTSYTPYQPEVAQGTLQSIYEFQSLVCELTGMDVANSAMYDGATALAEAALMACRWTKRERVLVADTVHPFSRNVLATYFHGQDLTIEEAPAWGPATDGGGPLHRRADLASAVDDRTACLIVQQPNFLGWLEEVEGLAEATHAAGALLVVAVDPISLGLLRPPGAYGADIVVGEGKWTGWPPDFGGPSVGLFAARQEYVRQLPGRIVGATEDEDGRRAFVLTLQTREQHIRRERATSNICTSEALVALGMTIYLCQMGKHGLREAATLSLQKAHYAASRCDQLAGYSVVSGAPYFKEFVLRCPRPVSEVNRVLLERGIMGGLDLGRYYSDLDDHMLICVTEINTRAEIEALVAGLEAAR
ncbi:MAG: aminomethyl-transferring glycine dehydrogenase [Dehalococcoidia bacterium]|nr:aminomethyl-transferring glycine dehydrogenase [Dehalococcoidia bacterium]